MKSAHSHNEYKQLIEYRIKVLNKFLKERGEDIEYTTTYVSHYGGWDLFYNAVGIEGVRTCRRGVFGFDARKDNEQMLQYLDGIFNTIHYIKNTNNGTK